MLETHKEIECINASDGAYIEGTKPLKQNKLKELTTNIKPNKSKIITDILINTSAPLNHKNLIINLTEHWKQFLPAIEKSIKLYLDELNTNISTAGELLEALAEQNKTMLLLFNTVPQLSTLLSGSFIQFQNIVSALLLNFDDGENIKLATSEIRSMLTDYFNDMFFICTTMTSTESKKFDLTDFLKKYPEALLQS